MKSFNNIYQVKTHINKNNNLCAIISYDGIFLYCNEDFSRALTGESASYLEGIHSHNFFPTEFQEIVPSVFSSEFDISEEYIPRVYLNANKLAFLCKVKLETISIKNVYYIYVQIKKGSISYDKHEIELQRLRQKIEVLEKRLKIETQKKNTQIIEDSIIDRKSIINHGFSSKISYLYPNISSNDIVVCSMILKDYDCKEISEKLNVSVHSVYSSRKRLRKKLNIPQSTNLYSFLKQVDSGVSLKNNLKKN